MPDLHKIYKEANFLYNSSRIMYREMENLTSINFTDKYRSLMFKLEDLQITAKSLVEKIEQTIEEEES